MSFFRLGAMIFELHCDETRANSTWFYSASEFLNVCDATFGLLESRETVIEQNAFIAGPTLQAASNTDKGSRSRIFNLQACTKCS